MMMDATPGATMMATVTTPGAMMFVTEKLI